MKALENTNSCKFNFRKLFIFLIIFVFVFVPLLRPNTTFAGESDLSFWDAFKFFVSGGEGVTSVTVGSVTEHSNNSKFGCNPGAVLPAGESFKLLNCIVEIYYYFVLSPIAWLTGAVASFFDLVIQKTILAGMKPFTAGIEIAWIVIRDLVNITFIFGLLVMAFKLVLGTQSNKDSNKFVRIIIAAVLINFSYFFVNILINFSNSAASSIYSTIISNNFTNDPKGQLNFNVKGSEKNLANIFIAPLKLETIYQSGADPTEIPTMDKPGQVFLIFVIGTFVLLILSIVLIMAITLLVARLVILLIILALSPLMFFGFIFPNYQKKIDDDFWQTLVGQLIFPVAFFILLWISGLVLNNFINPQSKDTKGWTDLAVSNLLSIDSLNIVINFAVVIALLISSILIARSISKRGSKYVNNVQDWTSRAVNSVPAFLGRNTIGAGGRMLANSQTVANLAGNENSRFARSIGRGTMRLGDSIAKSSFDVRGVDKFIDKPPTIGTYRAGGLESDIESRKKRNAKIEERLKRETPQERRQREDIEKQIKDKEDQIEELREDHKDNSDIIAEANEVRRRIGESGRDRRADLSLVRNERNDARKEAEEAEKEAAVAKRALEAEERALKTATDNKNRLEAKEAQDLADRDSATQALAALAPRIDEGAITREADLRNEIAEIDGDLEAVEKIRRAAETRRTLEEQLNRTPPTDQVTLRNIRMQISQIDNEIITSSRSSRIVQDLEREKTAKEAQLATAQTPQQVASIRAEIQNIENQISNPETIVVDRIVAERDAKVAEAELVGKRIDRQAIAERDVQTRKLQTAENNIQETERNRAAIQPIIDIHETLVTDYENAVIVGDTQEIARLEIEIKNAEETIDQAPDSSIKFTNQKERRQKRFDRAKTEYEGDNNRGIVGKATIRDEKQASFNQIDKKYRDKVADDKAKQKEERDEIRNAINEITRNVSVGDITGADQGEEKINALIEENRTINSQISELRRGVTDPNMPEMNEKGIEQLKEDAKAVGKRAKRAGDKFAEDLEPNIVTSAIIPPRIITHYSRKEAAEEYRRSRRNAKK